MPIARLEETPRYRHVFQGTRETLCARCARPRGFGRSVPRSCKLYTGGHTMNSSRALRSRLLAAMGLGVLSAAPVLGCGGDTSSPQGGSTDGGTDASGGGASN